MPVYKANETGGQPMDPKDPGDVLDYLADFAALTNGNGSEDWLDTTNSETISSYTVTVPSGITKDSDSAKNSNTGVEVWLSGGTAGTSYSIVFDVVTTAGRTKTVRMIVEVADR